MDDHFRALGEDIIASVRRLGLITYRIAMIMSALRIMEDGCFEDNIGSSTAGQKTIRRQLFLDKLPESFSRKEFIDISASLGIPLKTAERHVSQWCKDGVIERVDHGQYVKK